MFEEGWLFGRARAHVCTQTHTDAQTSKINIQRYKRSGVEGPEKGAVGVVSEEFWARIFCISLERREQACARNRHTNPRKMVYGVCIYMYVYCKTPCHILKSRACVCVSYHCNWTDALETTLVTFKQNLKYRCRRRVSCAIVILYFLNSQIQAEYYYETPF